MAKLKKFELNREGVRSLLKSDEMMRVCETYANNALSALGDGYEKSNHVGRNRVNVEIKAESYEAKKDNLDNNSILKALGG